MRYWVAFNQERAAQSWFRSVLCCSGPLAAYRRSTLTSACWDDYISQTFRGVSCTYGDDRHLTNLVLAAGHDTLFVPGATAITNAPESLRGYLKQQLRWNKSFYRELLWTLPYLLRRSAYMVFEVIVQTLLPLLLTLAIASSLVFAILVNPAHLVHYVLAITVMALVRCSYAIFRTRRPSFLLFVLYGFIHAALLVPLRMRALTTLTDNSWGTRTAVQKTTA
jgi:hyaluronan synthase/N-acetylglucosaminyltransferase